MENFKSRLKSVKAFMFDVDGVLTDGAVLCMSDGEQLRTFNIKDGYAIELAVKLGYKVAIISGGKNEMVHKRLIGLGIKDIFLGCSNKLEKYNELLKTYNITSAEVLYMGDDIPDYEVMKQVGIPTCPNDSSQEIKDISIYISHQKGGNGAVRDVIEQVLKVQDKWMK